MKLKVDIKEVNPCEKILTINVPSELVKGQFSIFYKAVQKQARVPGFRPGHAPEHVLQLHYRDEARREVWKQLVSRTFHDAVEQESIPIVGYPRIENVEFDEGRLKFKAHVETRPKIKIDKYVRLAVNRDPIRISDSEVEAALKRIQESHAKFQAVEGRKAALGDFLICDYRLSVDQKEVEKRAGEWIEIREQDYLEGFSKQLIDVWPGEAREIIVTFAEGYARKEFAGKEGRFSVTVHEIKEKKLHPLDDEFAKEVGEHETLENLKKSIRRDLEQHKQIEVNQQVERAILDELIRKSKFTIPQGMVERRLSALVEDGIQVLRYRGLKEEDLEGEKEKLRKKFLPEAQRGVRVSFLLDEIATREQIRATDEDLFVKYQLISAQSRRPAEDVKAYYGEHEDRMESLLQQVVAEKTIQWLREKAVITEASSQHLT